MVGVRLKIRLEEIAKNTENLNIKKSKIKIKKPLKCEQNVATIFFYFMQQKLHVNKQPFVQTKLMHKLEVERTVEN